MKEWGQDGFHNVYSLRRSLWRAVIEAAESVLLEDGEPIDDWTDDLMGEGGTHYSGEWVADEVKYILARLEQRKNHIVSNRPETA